MINKPKLEKVLEDYRGLPWYKQIYRKWLDPPRFKLVEDWMVCGAGGTSILDDGTVPVIPEGFITDFASIPRPLWAFIAPDGPLCLGAIVHDFGYQYGYLLSVLFEEKQYPVRSYELSETYGDLFHGFMPVCVGYDQKFFDDLLYHLTVETTGATVEAVEAYAALRVFGRIAWNKYRIYGPAAYNKNSLGLPGI